MQRLIPANIREIIIIDLWELSSRQTRAPNPCYELNFRKHRCSLQKQKTGHSTKK